MAQVTLVKNIKVSSPENNNSATHYVLELEITTATDNTPKEIFVKQRILKENLIVDEFRCVASPTQLEDLPVNSPNADESYFRVSKVEIIFSHIDTLEYNWSIMLEEIQDLMSQLDNLENVEETETLQINADGATTI